MKNNIILTTRIAIISLLVSLLAVKSAVCQNEDTVMTTIWCDDFEGGGGPWRLVDNDGNGNNWTVSSNYPNSGTYSLFAGFSTTQEDNWAISPAVAIADTLSHVELTWQVSGYGNYVESYDCLIVHGDSVTSEYDSVYGEQVSGGYYARSVDLSQYAGDTIHVVFRHRSHFQNFLCIDDVCISGTAHRQNPEPHQPTVTIVSADSALIGEQVSFHAEGEYAETYLWTFEGADTESSTEQTATATWSDTGRYTVTVLVTNEEGRATDMKTITIYKEAETGVRESIEKLEIEIYPNPAGDIVTVEAPVECETTILDQKGVCVVESTRAKKIEVSDLPRGIYHVVISDGKRCVTRKLLHL